MLIKIAVGWLLLSQLSICHALPASDPSKQTVRAMVSSADIAQWSIGLLVVLGVFFLCIWGVHKFGGLHASGEGKMRVVGGLSLGMREKVILLQVGKKQLVLGVTPGRIQTLHVLEGDDCLVKEDTVPKAIEGAFAQKLMQAIKFRPDA